MIKIKIGCSNMELEDKDQTISRVQDPKIGDPDAEEDRLQDPTLMRQYHDELAKSRLTKDELSNPHIRFLVAHGYIPVVHRGQESRYYEETIMPVEFGRGAQGTVYEVTKGGRRFAGKVASKGALDKELMVRTKVEEIRHELPVEVSKHIVRTFDIFSDEKYNGYILEIMRPMTDLENSIMFRGLASIDRLINRKTQKGWDNQYDKKSKDLKFQSYSDYRHFVDPNWGPKEVQMFEKQKEFVDALLYLGNHYGIQWRDLHEGNVMVRPSTRDYVATDIGYFDIKGVHVR